MSTHAVRDVYLAHLKHLGDLLQSAETGAQEAYALKRTADLAYDVAKERVAHLTEERERVVADFRREFPNLSISVI